MKKSHEPEPRIRFAMRFPSSRLERKRMPKSHHCIVTGFTALLLAATGCGVKFNTLPTVTLSPVSLAWHRVNIGNTSGVKVVTVTNTSPAEAIPLSIASITLSANFIETATTCPLAPQFLAPGATCTISVAFRPQTSGDLTGALSLNDNVMGAPASVALSAKGGIGFLLFDPTSLDFPGVAPNTVSQPQTATLTNEAATPVIIAKFTTSSRFSEGDNCPIAPDTLAPGGSCTVTVASDPVASGSTTGVVNVEDDLGNVTQLYLSGSDQGRQDVGVLNFSPSSLLWGKVTVGATSTAKSVTISNTQSGDVSFSNIATGPDYTIASSTCAGTLAGGQSCTVSVAFRPTKAGQITELLTFIDNATGSPQALALNGTGVSGNLLFAPTSLSFAGIEPAQASPAQSAVLTNETQEPLGLVSITVSGRFTQTNNCPVTLGVQASCTFEVTANPTADGIITGAVDVKDSAGNSTQLYLKGEGGNADKVLSFSPDPLVWGSIDVGQTSGSKTLTVDNGQTVPLTIYSVSIGQDFIQTASTCPTAPATVAAGTSCTISVAFRPYSSGGKNEVITFTDDAPGGNQSVSLSGTGATGPLLFNPTSLTFAGIDPNSVSQPQTATLRNEQASTITLASITLSGHFAQTNDCPTTLGPQASCTFTITSNPVIDGPIQGSVNIADGSGAIAQLYLSGMGGVPIDSSGGGTNQVVVSPATLAFRSVMVGQTSGSLPVTLSNRGSNSVAVPSIAMGPDMYEAANNCPVAPSALPGGAACTVSVAFRPQSPGNKQESIRVNSRVTSGLQTTRVTGRAVQGPLLFGPTSLSFPDALISALSAPQHARLSNVLATAVTLESIHATGPFVQTNDCPMSSGSLAPGATCTISVQADPVSAGGFSGTLNVTDSSGAVTQLYLSGAATQSQ